MKARFFVNGRFVAQGFLDAPKHDRIEVAFLIVEDEGASKTRGWDVIINADATEISFCRHQARTPKGFCTDCETFS